MPHITLQSLETPMTNNLLIHIPTIHLNGTSPDVLVDNLTAAMDKINEACRALEQCCPDGRDYPNGGMEEALQQHKSYVLKLCGVYYDLQNMARGIREQQ